MKLLAMLGVALHWVMFTLLNERGEAGAGAAGDAGKGDAGDAPKFTQVQLDAIIKERLGRATEKFKDYDDLVKFKTEHQKTLDEQTLKDQEAQKEYIKAKETYEKRISELSGVVSQKDKDITSLRINHALTNELSKSNAYVEEASALLSGQVQVAADGTLFIKGKDANGLDVNLTLEEGVKQFLTKRPHLVKASARAGAGSGGGTGGEGQGGGAGETADLMQLNQEFLKEMGPGGDRKKAGELRTKIQGILATARKNKSQ